MSKKHPTYQEAFDELQAISNTLEKENPSIDDLEKLVKRGRELILFCQKKLKKTQEDLEF